MNESLFEISPMSPRSKVAEKASAAYRSALEAGEIRLPPSTTVDQVMAMSSPPWHTATENPFVRSWVEDAQEDRPDRKDPGPYLADVKGSKASLWFRAHSYPTKVPPEIIQRLLLHYTEPGDVVLDGFAGSGMTGVAAQLCAKPDPEIEADLRARGSRPTWGTRRAVLNDLAPNATFLGSGVNLPVSAVGFEQTATSLLDRLDNELGWMYQTSTPEGEQATIDYMVWTAVFTCPHCGAAVNFYDGAFISIKEGIRGSFPCSTCGAIVAKSGAGRSNLNRRMETVRLLTGEVIERVAMRPARIHYRYGSGKQEVVGNKAPDDNDLAVLDRVASLPIVSGPRYSFPYRHMTHERSTLVKQGFSTVESLYPDRAMVSLAKLWEWAGDEPDQNLRRALKFWIEQAFWGLSWMNRYRPEGFSQVSQFQSGVFYVGSLISECSPRYNLEGSKPNRGKRSTLTKFWNSVSPGADVRITTGDATRLPLEDESIDYIFVDPPFGANIPYADLAQVIEGWHGVHTEIEFEAIVDRNRKAPKTVDDYANLLSACFKEFSRVLKSGRWMTVEFSNSSNEVWAALQNALASAGFVVADTRILDKQSASYRQATATNAVNQDLMISCYKPATQTSSAVLASGGAASSVWEFVGEHLKHLPIYEQTGASVRERKADRIYHRAVAYYVSLGLDVPHTAAEFYAGLDEHFNERDGLYFRPEQVEEYERKRLELSVPEQALFVTDERSAVAWLRHHLKGKPQTMAEIQPAFLQELQVSGDRPDQMPDLLEMLDENFIQDATGAWLVPDMAKLEHLQKLRERSLLRAFESYLSGTGQLQRFRGEALQAGLKDRWAKKDYATVAALGKRLPAEYLVENTAIMHYVRNAAARATK